MTISQPLATMLVNGVAADTVAVLNRGLMYGDGVFRTLRVVGGRPRYWARHYRRLVADCSRLAITPPEEALLKEELDRLIRSAPDCVVKIVVTRGEGGRGYAPPREAHPTRILLKTALPTYPPHYWETGVRLHLCRLRLAHQPRLAGIKHLNRLENVLARAEWSDPDVPEGLLLDVEGNVIEGTMTNLFMRQGARLITSDLSRCGVAGVTRECILEVAPHLGLTSEERSFGLAELFAADEVLVCNSLIGLWPVRALEGRQWQPGSLVARLSQSLESLDA
ncbi:aminodeoxychorismate lyase [Thiobacter aerophilum]|uniref:aminodeoxychorismate lyase n=1 Tax=Thiobacter aerophilum TaxID=3121275 RepID=A0ABV0EAG4_9BURK